MIDLEMRLRSALSDAAQDQAVPEGFDERVARRVAARRRRKLAARGAIAASVAVAIVVGAVAIRPDSGRTRVATGGSHVRPGWHPISQGPLSPRFQSLSLAMGDRVLVLGGGNNNAVQTDGAVYDATSDTWHVVARSPFPGSDLIGAWTGREAIVVSGDRGDVRAASYNPDDNSWRALATPPIPVAASATTKAIWTGTEIVLIGISGGDDSHDRANHTLIYDPTADQWRTGSVPVEPLPDFGDAVWTGTEIAVVGAVNQSGASTGNDELLTYNPATDQWKTFFWQLNGVRNNPVVVWTGSKLFIGGGGSKYTGPRLSDATLVDLATETWTYVPPAPIAFQGNGRDGEIWTGDQVLTLDGEGTRPLAFNPTTTTWEVGPPAPSGSRRVETGWPWISSLRSVVVWGGGTTTGDGTRITGCCTPVGDGQTYTPKAAESAVVDGSASTRAPDIRGLSADDPVVRAALRVLPPNARLDNARQVVDQSRDNGADYYKIEASTGHTTYNMLIYRKFAEDELTVPTIVNGAKTWPGRTTRSDAYLYYLSPRGVGLYVAEKGRLTANTDAELMDIAERASNDPVIRAFATQH